MYINTYFHCLGYDFVKDLYSKLTKIPLGKLIATQINLSFDYMKFISHYLIINHTSNIICIFCQSNVVFAVIKGVFDGKAYKEGSVHVCSI